MEQKVFFVSFEDSGDTAMQTYDLRNTVRRMNQINKAFEPEGTADAVIITPAVFHGYGGYFVSGVSNDFKDSCWDLLMHRYASEANDKKSGVFFYQREYFLMKRQQMKLATAETA